MDSWLQATRLKKTTLTRPMSMNSPLFCLKVTGHAYLLLFVCLMRAWNLFLKTKFRDSFLSLNTVYRDNLHEEVINNI